MFYYEIYQIKLDVTQEIIPDIKLKRFLGTPEEIILKCEPNSTYGVELNDVISYSLFQASYLHGDQNLWHQYQQQLKSYLNEKCETIAATFFQFHQSMFEKMQRINARSTGNIDIKNDVIALLTYFITDLKLKYNIDSQTTIDTIYRLCDKRCFSLSFAASIKLLMAEANHIRCTSQFLLGAQQKLEEVSFDPSLYQAVLAVLNKLLDTQSEAESLQQMFRLISRPLMMGGFDILDQVYYVKLLPLDLAIQFLLECIFYTNFTVLINYYINKVFRLEQYEAYYWNLSWEQRKHMLTMLEKLLEALQKSQIPQEELTPLQKWLDEIPRNAAGTHKISTLIRQYWDEQVASLTTSKKDSNVILQWLDSSGQLHKGKLKQEYVAVLFATDGSPRLDNRDHGRCIVKLLKNADKELAYVKFYPQYPLRQYATDELTYRLSGFGAVTTLAKITHPKRPNQTYPILLSMPLGPTLLKRRLCRIQEDLKLDQKAFTWKVIETLLLQPEDDKDDNVAMTPVSANTNRLISIDNDHIIPQQEVENSQTTVNSIIYFLPDMLNQLHLQTLQAYINLVPDQLLLSWWQSITQYAQHIVGDDPQQFLFTRAEGENCKTKYFFKYSGGEYNLFCDLTAIFRLEDIPALCSRMLHLKVMLQSAIKKQWPHQMLFEEFEPRLAFYYQEAAKKGSDPYTRFHNLPNQMKMVQDQDTQKSYSASSLIKPRSGIVRLLTFNKVESKYLSIDIIQVTRTIADITFYYAHINEVHQEVLNKNLDKFKPAPDFIKEIIINKIKWSQFGEFGSQLLQTCINTKTSFHRLVLESCVILTDDILLQILIHSSKLQYLNISNCTQLTTTTLWSISGYCPHLKVLRASNLPGLSYISDSLYYSRTTFMSFPSLQRLYLNDCINISLLKLFSWNQIPKLVFVDLSNCNEISDTNLIDFVLGSKTLQHIKIEDARKTKIRPLLKNRCLSALTNQNHEQIKRLLLLDDVIHYRLNDSGFSALTRRTTGILNIFAN